MEDRSMEATETPKRPWWRKKRWATPLALWLLVAYPLSIGPAGYLSHRGWLRPETATAFCRPIEWLLPRRGPAQRRFSGSLWVSVRQDNPRTRWFWAYVDRWDALAFRQIDAEKGRRRSASEESN
jgi:hypothetical protein